MDERIKGWRKLHDKELHNLYCSQKKYWGDKFKEHVVGRACTMHERREDSSHKILVGKPGEGELGKLSLG
jgi:hypothetical protein